jgi:hypothetical protein
MATHFAENEPRLHHKAGTVVGAGGLAEAFGAGAAAVLAILGLAGALPLTMACVATILLGAAFLFEGGAVLARYRHVVQAIARPDEEHAIRAEVGGGTTAETLAGIAGIVLGILSLLGVFPEVLLPVALIGFGGGMLLGSAATSRLGSAAMEEAGVGERLRHVMHEAVHASSGSKTFVGIGAMVLGILALLGLFPLTLTLAGLLAVALVALLSGTALGARMLGFVRHHPA